MKHSELLQRINIGIVVARFKIISLGTQEEDVARQSLLASFTGVMKLDNQQYGILPIIDQREDHFSLFWEITPVIRVDGKWNRQVLPTDRVRSLLQTAINDDSDLRQFFSKYEFEVYDGN